MLFRIASSAIPAKVAAWLAVMSLATLAGLAALATASVPIKIRLDADRINHDQNCAYFYPLPERLGPWPLTRIVSDGDDAPHSSNGELLENHRVLGPSHALHAIIRESGKGHFSHWHGAVFFSASDCTDPRTNGRTYEFSATPRVAPGLFFALFVSLTFALLNVPEVRTRISNRLTPAIEKGRQLAALLLERRILALCLFGLAAVFLSLSWRYAFPASLALASHYQISDASGYWHCANTLLERGTYSTGSYLREWCQRRPIYPAWLAGLKILGLPGVKSTLMLQALLLGSALCVLVVRVREALGPPAALAALPLLGAFWMQEAMALTMTENVGLLLGCLGLALLLAACGSGRMAWAYAGIAAISLGLNARAGAMFILPALVGWAALAARQFNVPWHRAALLASLAAACGFIVQALLMSLGGSSVSQAHGNFSYTLYGLAAGGKGWLQVMSDHPEIQQLDEAAKNSRIYALAISAIQADPRPLFSALGSNLALALTRGTYDFTRFGTSMHCILVGLWAIGGCTAVRNLRHPLASLAIVGTVGVLVSAPVLINDGGPRVFAATIGFDILLVAFGVSATFRLLSKLCSGLPAGQHAEMRPAPTALPPRVEFALLCVFITVAALPFTPVRQLANINPSTASECPPGLKGVAARLGRESLMIAATEGVDPADGTQRWKTPAGAWWAEGLESFTSGTLISAYQLDHDDPSSPRNYGVRSDVDLSRFAGKQVTLCIDERDIKYFFGEPYGKAVVIRHD
jgi:hypothetical protein